MAMDWKNKFGQEMQMAEDARARGNEGQARVCARRAAGAAVREYFEGRGVQVRTSSAYDLLKALLETSDLSAGARQQAEYLTLKVTEEFRLPVDADLLQAARLLAGELLPEQG